MTAQYVAGSFYERGGDGVERNLNVARAYYAAAATAMKQVRQICINRFCRATLMIKLTATPSVVSAVPP